MENLTEPKANSIGSNGNQKRKLGKNYVKDDGLGKEIEIRNV